MSFASALRLFRRNSPGAHEPEPADMGTAFGMEASVAASATLRSRTPPHRIEK